MVCHIDWLVHIEEYLYLWDKSNLIMVYDPFNALLDSACQYFVEDFCVYVHQWYWPLIFYCFYCVCLSLPVSFFPFIIFIFFIVVFSFREITLTYIIKPVRWCWSKLFLVYKKPYIAFKSEWYPWYAKKWQPIPVFLPGKFHAQRSLESPSLWGCKESDTT